MHKYSDEQKEFIGKNIKGRNTFELTGMFNAVFGTRLKQTQIKAFVKNNNLSSGLDCRFKKGQVAHNKNKKFKGGWEPTQYKRGNKSHNCVPIGTERVNGDGYIDIKIQDGTLHKNWKGKHTLIWETANGPVPKSHSVIFGDGNNRNFDLNNLILVSRKQLLILNRKKLIQKDADLTRTAVVIADVYSKIGERNKRKGC